MGKYTITESVDKQGGRQDVHTYEDLERHHPSSAEDTTRRSYDDVNGEREEVRNLSDGRLLVKKDFILSQDTPGPVNIPAPVSGFVRHTNDGVNTIEIYDGKGPDAVLLARVLHMEHGTSPPNGARIEYGQPLGQMGDTGSVGSIHAHVELEAGQFQNYIRDIDNGTIQPGVISPMADGVLRHKEEGEEVKRLQEALNRNGAELPTDGVFGSLTQAAVIEFQRQQGLEPDGIAGSRTLAALGIATEPAQQSAAAQPGTSALAPAAPEAAAPASAPEPATSAPATSATTPAPEPATSAPASSPATAPEPATSAPATSATTPAPEPATSAPASSPSAAPAPAPGPAPAASTSAESASPAAPPRQPEAGPAVAAAPPPFQDNPLSALISSGEGGYGSYNRGVAGDANGAQIDFSTMTVGEIMRRQKLHTDSPGHPDELFAVGKYQITTETMAEAVEKLGIDPDQPFTPELQERIFADYLVDEKREQVRAYITGDGNAQSLGAAQLALAQEFASVAHPDTNRSAHDGVGGNSASITAAQTASALEEMRERYQRNVENGMSANEAYREVMTGDPNSPYPSALGGVLREEKGSPDDVRELQAALNRNGANLSVSGTFDAATTEAVKAFQRDHGLEDDGIAGPKTLTALGIGQPGRTPDAPAQAPAEAPPEAAAQGAGQAPAQAPAPAPAQAPGQAPAQTAAEAAAQLAGQTPAQAPVQAPVQAPGQAPTQDPAQAPTQAPADSAPAASPACPVVPPKSKPAPVDLPAQAPIPAERPGPPLISDSKHADNPMYLQAIAGLEKLGPQAGFGDRKELERAAAALVYEARVSGMKSIDHVVQSADGNKLFAVQGELHDASHRRVVTDKGHAVSQSVEQSSRSLGQDVPAVPYPPADHAQTTASRPMAY